MTKTRTLSITVLLTLLSMFLDVCAFENEENSFSQSSYELTTPYEDAEQESAPSNHAGKETRPSINQRNIITLYEEEDANEPCDLSLYIPADANMAIAKESSTSIDAAYFENARCSQISEDWHQWTFKLDLLYWRAYESGLSCGAGLVEESQSFSSDGRFHIKVSEKDCDPNFRWELGLRLALRYGFNCSWWDANIAATYFHSKNNETRRQVKKGEWQLDFDQVDLTVGRTIWINGCFDWRPFVGIRGAKVDQCLKSRNCHLDSYSSDEFFIGTRLHDYQNFRGIGPLLGAELNWDIGCGFKFYGNLSGAILYGDVHAKFLDTDMNECCTVTSQVEQCFFGSQPVFDIEIGVCWHRSFCKNRLQLLLKLGLEHHRLFNYNQLSFINGDLCLDGATFSGTIRF